MFVAELISELGYNSYGNTKPFQLNFDNQAAIKLAENPVNHPAIKYLKMRFHWIRERVAEADIHLKWVDTNNQFADTLTKPLGTAKFIRAREVTGLRPNVVTV